MSEPGKSFRVAIILAWMSWASSGLAADAVVPTLTISREDVVQTSLQRFEVKDTTNDWLFTWEYTERGARRIRAFREAHVGQKTCMRIGDYETQPRLVSTNTNWLSEMRRHLVSTNQLSLEDKASGQTNRTTQVLRVNSEEAKKLLAELEPGGPMQHLARVADSRISGTIGTPGVIILQRKGKGEPLRIAGVVPRSPAERAGIRPDGFLITVDGTNAVNMSLTEALSRVRGVVGAFVTLELADSEMRHTNKCTFKRGELVHSKDRLEVIEK